jgi:pimeloyl-ACP methyl ester carboxylesterase
MNLVCIHGNSLDSTIFNGINVEGFEKKSLTLPGHGGRPLGEMNSFLDLVEGVYQEIAHLKDVVLLGSSLGGHIVHHLLTKMQPLAVITISSPPLNLETVGSAFTPNSVGQLLFQAQLSSHEATTLADSLLSLRKDLIPSLRDLILGTDPKAREVIAKSLISGEFLDEVALLKGFQGPKILVLPSMDSMVNKDYVRGIDYAQVVELEGNHILTWDNPAALNSLFSSLMHLQ